VASAVAKSLRLRASLTARSASVARDAVTQSPLIWTPARQQTCSVHVRPLFRLASPANAAFVGRNCRPTVAHEDGQRNHALQLARCGSAKAEYRLSRSFQKIDYAIVGAAAASVHGAMRASQDADALLSINVSALRDLERHFKAAGFEHSLQRLLTGHERQLDTGLELD